MNTALMLLIVLAVAAGPARALHCHVCSSSTNCKNVQLCPASARFCRTMTTVEPLRGNLVQKDCTDWCTPGSHQQAQSGSSWTTTQCCQGDSCNDRLQNSARRSLGSALLGLALGLLTLLLGH
ncbi:lymphocyte antigen 6D [Sorex araneus]|uniref:lymphocyte antigen 6D n=1 Tax=Sorex araneus TaxID=42254 RepID=UPI0003314FE0|nr:lymphocyte antigen 6D [Sorex araneus]